MKEDADAFCIKKYIIYFKGGVGGGGATQHNTHHHHQQQQKSPPRAETAHSARAHTNWGGRVGTGVKMSGLNYIVPTH